MRLPALARTTHKWFALILAIQAVFWTLSGVYMTAVHIDIIHGGTYDNFDIIHTHGSSVMAFV